MREFCLIWIAFGMFWTYLRTDELWHKLNHESYPNFAWHFYSLVFSGRMPRVSSAGRCHDDQSCLPVTFQLVVCCFGSEAVKPCYWNLVPVGSTDVLDWPVAAVASETKKSAYDCMLSQLLYDIRNMYLQLTRRTQRENQLLALYKQSNPDAPGIRVYLIGHWIFACHLNELCELVPNLLVITWNDFVYTTGQSWYQHRMQQHETWPMVVFHF